MDTEVVNYVTAVQKRIYGATKRKVDAHFQEGQGIIFVPSGAPLRRENVFHVIPWIQAEISMTSGHYHI
jgi:hypothetical protein